MSDVNKGWTIFGKRYHRALYHLGGHCFVAPIVCGIGLLDQTVTHHNGEPTGALVPDDLTPCKRCFPDGDA